MHGVDSSRTPVAAAAARPRSPNVGDADHRRAESTPLRGAVTLGLGDAARTDQAEARNGVGSCSLLVIPQALSGPNACAPRCSRHARLGVALVPRQHEHAARAPSKVPGKLGGVVHGLLAASVNGNRLLPNVPGSRSLAPKGGLLDVARRAAMPLRRGAGAQRGRAARDLRLVDAQAVLPVGVPFIRRVARGRDACDLADLLRSSAAHARCAARHHTVELLELRQATAPCSSVMR